MKLIHEMLDNTALNSGNKTAIVFKDKFIKYQEVREKSLQFGNYLLQQGLRKGDRVLLKMHNNVELVCLLMGISRIGGIAVIINPNTTQYNLDYIINDCTPELVIHEELQLSSRYAKKLESIHNIKKKIKKYDTCNISSDGLADLDTALLIYTSGSTGKPKAVIATHSNVIFCTKAISEVLKINKEDVIGNFLPLSFDYGLYQVFLSFYNKATMSLAESNLAGIQLVKYLKEFKVTIFPSMPHLTEGLIKLLPRYKDEFALKAITNTGENLPQSYILKIKELLPDCEIYPMYGLTECKRVSILKPAELESKPNSVGKPLPQVYCYVIDENANVLKPGQIGQLVVKGPNVMQGYWNNPNLTKERFRKSEIGLNDTLYTGDLFKIDPDGYLYFIGRVDDIFKKNGFRVSSKEIEETVYDLELAEIAALIPPDQTEKKSLLFVKTSNSVNYIKEKLRERLEYYKMPDEIIILDNFPTSNNKKIDKSELRKIRS